MRTAALTAVLAATWIFLPVTVEDADTVRSPGGEVTGEGHRVLGRTFVPGEPPPPTPDTGEPPPTAPEPDLLGDVRFCLACDELTAQAVRALTELVARVPADTCLSVEGHADRSGSSRSNRDLSRRRAVTVAAWLDAQSVDVSVQWFGEDRPRGGPDEADRRVEIAETPC